MPSPRIRKTKTLAAKTAELAFAVPQVVAHRTVRMALADPVLSARDRKEFERMGSEKLSAFTESWNAMALQALQASQAMALSMFRLCWSPWLGGNALARTSQEWHKSVLGVFNKGIGPVHRTATANARRLAKTRIF